jgi:hypothetical protein
MPGLQGSNPCLSEIGFPILKPHYTRHTDVRLYAEPRLTSTSLFPLVHQKLSQRRSPFHYQSDLYLFLKLYRW